MAKIKSNHNAPLPLPVAGTVLQPGKTVNVERWNVVSEHGTVKAWLVAGVIEVVTDEKPEAERPKGRKTAKDRAPGPETEEAVE